MKIVWKKFWTMETQLKYIVTDSFLFDKYNCQKNKDFCHKDLDPLQMFEKDTLKASQLVNPK